MAHMIVSACARDIQLANRDLQIKSEQTNRRYRALCALPAVDYLAVHL